MEEKKSRIFTRVKFFNLISEIIRHRKILTFLATQPVW